MTSTEPLFRYFGNKFAFLTGANWASPLGANNLDLAVEYARIEPFVYSHQDSLNIYTHYDKIIGHWLGPNADAWRLHAGYQVNRDLYLECSIEKQHKGRGDADTISRPESGNRKKFLDGIVENKMLLGLVATEQIRHDIFIRVAYNAIRTRNTQRTDGWQTTDHLIRFELMLNY